MKQGLRFRGYRRALGRVALGVLFTLFSGRALAHQVWLEVEKGEAKLYFGEFGDNQREVSPGYLDKVTRPTATLVSGKGEKVLEPVRARDGVVFKTAVTLGDSIVAHDAAYPVMEGKDGDKPRRTVWTPAARYVTDLSARAAKLTLDIVPTGAPGEFQVVYRGKPLPKAELKLTAMSGWSLDARSDDQGKVKFDLPWRGTYALLVRHKDASAGSRKSAQGADEAYDASSYATTLTFALGSGLPSPPRPPVAPPNPMPAKP